MKAKISGTAIVIVVVSLLAPILGPPAHARPDRPRALFGEAVVGSDSWGRIYIALDAAAEDGLPPDGRMDHLFLFTPETPVVQDIFAALDSANIVYSKRTLDLTTPDSSFRVHLSVGRSSPPRGVLVEEDSIRIRGGIELVHSFGIFETSIRGFHPVDVPPIGRGPEAHPDAVGFPTCDGQEACSGSIFGGGVRCKSGGPDASACEVKCNQSTGCGVSCQEGSYACCNCKIPTGPECKCVPLP